ncbi:sigma-54-dependent Fis family transcriptional regulator [Diaphorobacter sp. HDW4A]|uniref:sigma-54-dependent transcriptional regulator n=1 Tax=Diaphorobacter sp. HDW4A TaxID=2714924 RepID=UPI00140DB902|nr:sigma-54 dependent transcriptional regulator [Diaphorobacter sp. HDW4A]QIL83392.1 sigma-54-dependent Fis family transcriptional regulator [Diaphorobacter sp. HDW4A]
MPAYAASILVIDDEPDLRTLYELTLLREGYRVETAGSVAEARQQLRVQQFDVVISDMRLPDGYGMEVLLQLRESQRRERCVVMTAYGSAENAVEALRAGAFDYLTKPVDLKQFRSVVASAVQGTGGVPAPGQPAASLRVQGTENRPTAENESSTVSPMLRQLIGESEAMRNVKQRIAKVARSMAPVLVRGESGTGKELVARALHGSSQRSDGPMIAVNCSAIPENLLEAEFFGARKGSYTGATADRDGFFQAAQGGTLFLDEIGDLPLAMQSKLLRAIQERSIRPLGATQEETVDVRIVSATHKNLAAEVQAGTFRQDLYYRLNVIELLIPPLRERREDLPDLCRALLQRIEQDSGVPVPRLTGNALRRIAMHPLPGNVRELENLLHRAVALSDGDELFVDPPTASATPEPAPAPAAPTEPSPLVVKYSDASERAEMLPAGAPPPYPANTALPNDLQAWLDKQERDILVRALRESGFNRTATAARLGISLRQIRYRIERLNISEAEGGTDHVESE